jgi:SAM-dependent methyltransferase
VLPADVQLCELANPAKWDNPAWLALLRDIGGLSSARHAMHRKAYEFTQAMYGLGRLGVLGESARVLSVGAGHEPVLYWLANRVGSVVATDLYEGRWGADGEAEGDARVLSRPEEFAPYPYRRDRLTFLRMDGRRLAFRDGAFDAVYSLSSVEHFGGLDAARESVADMARVLRPGGVLALATEWHLSGPSRDEVFEPDEVRQLAGIAGLELVEPLDDRVWCRYAAEPVDLLRNPYQTPHLLVSDRGTVFTSVMLFLRRR